MRTFYNYIHHNTQITATCEQPDACSYYVPTRRLHNSQQTILKANEDSLFQQAAYYLKVRDIACQLTMQN